MLEKDRQNLAEGIFGTGAIYKKPDVKDYTYFGFGSKPVDWELGRDIRKILAFRSAVSKEEFDKYNLSNDDDYKKILTYLRKKGIDNYKTQILNQNGSSSCVGQMICWNQTAKNFLETGIWEMLSVKDIYPFIRLRNGGAYIYAGFQHKNNQGIAVEQLVSSYPNGLPPNEEFFKTLPELDSIEKISREISKGTEYRQIVQNNSIDKMAEAIRDYIIVGSGLRGKNNGTWYDEYPQPPEDGYGDWGHALPFCEYGLNENNKKYIGSPNSWGESVGVGGWQKITEDYFNNDLIHNAHIDNDAENFAEPKRPFEKAKEWLENNLERIKKENPNIYIGSYYHSIVWDEMQKALGLEDYSRGDFYNWAQFIKLDIK